MPSSVQVFISSVAIFFIQVPGRCSKEAQNLQHVDAQLHNVRYSNCAMAIKRNVDLATDIRWNGGPTSSSMFVLHSCAHKPFLDMLRHLYFSFLSVLCFDLLFMFLLCVRVLKPFTSWWFGLRVFIRTLV